MCPPSFGGCGASAHSLCHVAGQAATGGGSSMRSYMYADIRPCNGLTDEVLKGSA